MRKFYLCGLVLALTSFAFSFESGFHLQLHADFGGALTLPSISEEGLKDLNPKAVAMTGMMSDLLMGGEMEVGYIFRSDKFFGLSKENPFSGIGAFFTLGFSQGNASQKITAIEGGQNFDIFMSIDFLPLVNFGASAKAYFFNNRLAIGLGVMGRLIADMTPQYLSYSTLPNVIPTEVGTIVVTEDMIKKMNPFMVSVKLAVEYNIPILETTEMVLGTNIRYNSYAPKYLTMPATLLGMAIANGFDPNKPQNDYFLNSLDFGVSLGLAFKL